MKTQADCFRELARVMDMRDNTQVPLFMCLKNTSHERDISTIPRFDYPTQWSFAIAIVEDKPVFVGDTLWYANGIPCVVQYVDRDNKIVVKSISSDCCSEHSTSLYRNPPKPKEPATVMVELSVEDVAQIVYWRGIRCEHRLKEACRNALKSISK